MAYGNRCVANKFRRCSSAATAQSSLSAAGKKERERKREIVSEQVSLVCSRATQPGEKSTEKSCERRVCQLKAYNSPQTTSEQTSSNNEQQQEQRTTATATCTTRIWAKDKAAIDAGFQLHAQKSLHANAEQRQHLGQEGGKGRRCGWCTALWSHKSRAAKRRNDKTRVTSNAAQYAELDVVAKCQRNRNPNRNAQGMGFNGSS